MQPNQTTHTDHICLSDDDRSVRILDQRLLPNQTVYRTLSQPQELYEAIATLQVRGAPAIGIFAGYAMYVLAMQSTADRFGDFVDEMQKHHAYLNAARPTAVNLKHMLDRQLSVAVSMPCADVDTIRQMKHFLIFVMSLDFMLWTKHLMSGV